jgi:transcription initiation factor TFIIB
LKSSDRALINAFRDISAMCERISLPKKVADTAKQYFKTIEEKKLARGKSNEGMIAACIYVACR